MNPSHDVNTPEQAGRPKSPRLSHSRGAWDIGLFIAMLVVIIVAVVFRFPQLDLRPMHGDEAVNAVKYHQLRSGAGYRYDPHEFHGPLLPYATLPLGWISPAKDFTQMDPAYFRLLTAIAGVLLVVVTLMARRMIGPVAALFAALLCAISPAMTFYSRYYIHEMPLVLLSFAVIYCGWRYSLHRHVGWAIACGACAGLMHATKETCVIIWVAMALAGVVAWCLTRDREATSGGVDRRRIMRDAVMGVVAGLIVSITLFSSFFTNWHGVWDSIATYGTWIGLGMGHGSVHVHPWWWYLELLAWYHPSAGPWWSSALILVMAGIGCIASLTGWGIEPGHRRIAVFFAVYGLALLVLYSLIPYKTPWVVLGPLHGLIITAGIGAAVLLRRVPTVYAKAAIAIALLAGAGQLADKAYATNFRFYADRRNPWVYAHPGLDVLNLDERVRQIANVSKLGTGMTIVVIDSSNYWPLPYYLREFEHVGYFASPADMAKHSLPGAAVPLVIAGPDEAAAAHAMLDATHVHQHFGLRPGVVLTVFVRKDLWDAFIEMQKAKYGQS